MRGALALFAIRTTDDIVVRTNAGGRSTFTNVAKTRRQGVEASAEWTIDPRWSFAAAVSALEARYDEAFLTCGPPPCTTPTLPVADGNHLPGVPEQTLFLELRRRSDLVDLALEFRAQAPLYIDDRNTDRAAGYGVVNASAAKTFTVAGTTLRGFVRVDNLFDREYVGSVIVNEANGRFFEPAPGRTFLVGLDARF